MCTLARKEKLAGTYLMIISAWTEQVCFVVIVVQAAKQPHFLLKFIGAEYFCNLPDEVLNPQGLYSDCT